MLMLLGITTLSVEDRRYEYEMGKARKSPACTGGSRRCQCEPVDSSERA